VGADKPVPLGELVDLSLSPPADKPATLVSSSEIWKVWDVVSDASGTRLVEKKVREYVSPDGARGVFFSAGISDKRMVVAVAVTHLYAVRDEKDASRVSRVATKTALLTAELVIGNGGTPKPPEPKPGPDPKPVDPDPVPPPKPKDPEFPAGKFGLAKFVYGQVKGNTPADTRKAWADAHVKAYRAAVGDIKAGKLPVLRSALIDVTNKVHKAKSDAGLSADPGWSKVADAVEAELYSLYKDGKLNTPEDLAQALDEMIAGLEGAK
jgi:hypothetical protein